MNPRWSARIARSLACQEADIISFFAAYGVWSDQDPPSALYSAYHAFVKQIIFIHTTGVPLKTLARFLRHEATLISLLNEDASTNTRLLVEGWKQKGAAQQRLLLSRYDIGAQVESKSLQPRLDFTEQSEAELFTGQEMGEDALRALATCARDRQYIMGHLRKKAPLLVNVGNWIGKYG